MSLCKASCLLHEWNCSLPPRHSCCIAGPFAAAMQTESSVSVRLAILQAVLATHSTATLAPLVAVGTCGTLLAAWLSVSYSTWVYSDAYMSSSLHAGGLASHHALCTIYVCTTGGFSTCIFLCSASQMAPKPIFNWSDWRRMQEAELDRQKTFLRLALNAAARLPWTLPLLRSGGFLQAVNRLHKTPCASV